MRHKNYPSRFRYFSSKMFCFVLDIFGLKNVLGLDNFGNEKCFSLDIFGWIFLVGYFWHSI